MKYTVVLPSAYPPYTDECLATCKLANILVIDNTQVNLGVSASWNRGIDRVLGEGCYEDEEPSDWLILLSAAIRFGKPGGLDFIKHLEERPKAIVLEADHVFGWHLIAFNRKTIEKVGRFDETFFPGYYNDLDYSIRIQRAFKRTGQIWDKVPVQCTDMGMAHGLNLGGIRNLFNDQQRDYYESKWGARPGSNAEKYQTPFNDKKKPLSYWEKQTW